MPYRLCIIVSESSWYPLSVLFQVSEDDLTRVFTSLDSARSGKVSNIDVVQALRNAQQPAAAEVDMSEFVRLALDRCNNPPAIHETFFAWCKVLYERGE